MGKMIGSVLLIALLATTHVCAQRFVRNDDDGRRFALNFGIGAGLLKAGSAYSINPLFLTKPGLGWQMYIAPHYKVSDRTNVGIRLGGIFRPTFTDAESNSIIQSKFTSYGLAFAEYYISRPHTLLDYKFRPRFYVGLQAGVSYIGEMEAKDLTTDQTYLLRRRDRDMFLTISPKIGVALGKHFKLELEHIVTTPFNPDFTSLTLISSVLIGAPRYY